MVDDGTHRSALGAATLVALALLVGACTAGEPITPDLAGSPGPVVSNAAQTPSPQAEHDPAFVVRYRLQIGAGLDAAALAEQVDAVLTDGRGWARAGFLFARDDQRDTPASALPVAIITIADGATIDRACEPYDTFGRYSCQLGPTVNLNADRWHLATPEWTGTLEGYRTYLINHEVGHLIGLHHPDPQCPGAGYPAPVMLQQSTELGPCTANPWPLTWEIALAASRVEPFAPGYEPAPEARPSPPAVRE